MSTPHKHADLIKAWADGAKIQFWSDQVGDWMPTPTPRWMQDAVYRVEPKNFEVEVVVSRTYTLGLESDSLEEAERKSYLNKDSIMEEIRNGYANFIDEELNIYEVREV